MTALIKKKYSLEDARKQREPREYASSIIRSENAAGLSVVNQIMMIYNELDPEFQRDLRRPDESTNLKNVLLQLNEFRDI